MAKQYSERAHTGLTPEDMSSLTAFAEGNSTSVSHALRLAAREFLERHQTTGLKPGEAHENFAVDQRECGEV